MPRVFIAPVSGPCEVFDARGIPFWFWGLDRKLRGA